MQPLRPDEQRSRTGAVVLAAGGGRRFVGPGHKLTSPVDDGETLVQRALAVAVAAAIGPVAVVLGAVGADGLDLPDEVAVLTNDRWAEGQASSLLVAVAWASGLGLDAVVVGLGDQPGLEPEAWRRVAEAVDTPITVATYGGRRGHPTRLAAPTWAVLPTDGDTGARPLLAARPEWVTEVACAGDPTDIDTVEDLAAWRVLGRRPSDG